MAVVMKNKTADIKWYMHTTVVFVFVFGFGILPPFEPITPIGMKIAGIFIGVIYGWSTVGMIWPSILGFIALGLSGAMPMNQLLAAGYGNDIFPMMLMMFTVMKVIEANGVGGYIANKIIGLKVLRGRPWLFTFAMLLGCFLVSTFAGGIFIAVLMFWAIFYGIFEKFGYQRYEKYPVLMIIGVMFVCCFSLIVFPFKGNSIMLIATFMSMTNGLEIDFLKYMCFTFPISFVMIIAYTLVCKYVFRVDLSAMKNIDDSFVNKNELTLNKYQKVSIGLLAAVIIIMAAPSLLPKELLISTILSTLGMTGRFGLLIIAISIIRIDGKPLLDFKKMAAEGVMWDAVFLTTFILPISGLLTADITGIKPFLIQMLSPFLAGTSPFIFTALLMMIGVVLTNFANNTVICMILISVVVSFSGTMGIDPIPISIMLMVASHMALLTPAASPFAAILFGNSAWVRPKDIYKYGSIAVGICTLTFIIVGYILMKIIF